MRHLKKKMAKPVPTRPMPMKKDSGTYEYFTFEEMQSEIEAYKLLQHRRNKVQDEIKVLLKLLNDMDENLEKKANEIEGKQLRICLGVRPSLRGHHDLLNNIKDDKKDFVFKSVHNKEPGINIPGADLSDVVGFAGSLAGGRTGEMLGDFIADTASGFLNNGLEGVVPKGKRSGRRNSK